LINHWQPHCWPTPSTIFFPIPNGKVVSQPTQVSLCLNPKLVIQFEGCLLLPLLDALVDIAHHSMTSKDHLNFMAYLLNEQIMVTVVGNNVSWNALKSLKLTIDVISMPLKNMGLKDGPFKPILNLNFIA